jgi:hypothetical protein
MKSYRIVSLTREHNGYVSVNEYTTDPRPYIGHYGYGTYQYQHTSETTRYCNKIYTIVTDYEDIYKAEYCGHLLRYPGVYTDAVLYGGRPYYLVDGKSKDKNVWTYANRDSSRMVLDIDWRKITPLSKKQKGEN